MKKSSFFIILLLTFYTNYGQQQLNDYKYIIVPQQFEFQKAENQYQLNALTKFLLEKEHFNVIYQNSEYPLDYTSNRCLGLFFNLHKNNTLFKITLDFDLVDCNKNTVFSSKQGVSRDKDYKKAYHEALRMAFRSLKGKNYVYSNKPQKIIVSKAVRKLPTTKAKAMISTQSPLKILNAKPIAEGFVLLDKAEALHYTILNTHLKDVFFIKNTEKLFNKNAILYKQGDFWVIEYYDGKILRNKKLKILF